jgi:GAF domain-containing protein
MVDMLRRIIRPDLVYVRLQGLAEGVRCEAASVDPQLALPPQAEEIGRALAPWLNTKGVLSCAAIPNPGGNGTLQIVVLPIGHAGEYGVVAAASRRPDFPSAEYRLLLDVSIHQAAIALQEVRLIADLRAANLVKGQWLKQEQLLRAEAEVARQQTTTILERIADRFVALDRDWQSTYRHWAAERLLQGIQRTQVEFIDKTMEEVGQEIVEVMPTAWQYPDITCAQITLEGQVFTTHNFTVTTWKQASDICVHGKRIGAVEVYYLQEKPPCDEGPFLKEERSLLDTVAKLLGEMVGRKHAEEERARYAAQLQALAEAALAINSAGSLTEAISIATEKAREIIGAHQAVTGFSIDKHWTQSIEAMSLSDKYAGYRGYRSRPNGSGIYRLVCQTNQPRRLTQTELEEHPAWRSYGRDAGRHPPLRGWLAAPLIGRDGRNIGLMQLSDKYQGEFTADDEAILVQLAQASIPRLSLPPVVASRACVSVPWPWVGNCTSMRRRAPAPESWRNGLSTARSSLYALWRYDSHELHSRVDRRRSCARAGGHACLAGTSAGG